MTVAAQNNEPPSSIRTGSKVPVRSGTSIPQYQYVDVGVNIDSRNAREIQDQLALTVSADVSSYVAEADASAPLVRQTKWNSTVIVPFKKPTVIFSSDDPTSKRQMQLELTATRIESR